MQPGPGTVRRKTRKGKGDKQIVSRAVWTKMLCLELTQHNAPFLYQQHHIMTMVRLENIAIWAVIVVMFTNRRAIYSHGGPGWELVWITWLWMGITGVYLQFWDFIKHHLWLIFYVCNLMDPLYSRFSCLCNRCHTDMYSSIVIKVKWK